MTPDDAMYWCGGLGRPHSRKPKYVGVLVWIPYEDYESATSADAVDPSADSNTGNTSTREKASSVLSEGTREGKTL